MIKRTLSHENQALDKLKIDATRQNERRGEGSRDKDTEDLLIKLESVVWFRNTNIARVNVTDTKESTKYPLPDS